VDAKRTAAFDVNDSTAMAQFFQSLAAIDHVLVTAGRPHYGPMLEMDAAQVRDALGDHAGTALEVTRNAVGKMSPGGTLLFMGGTATYDIDGGQQFVP
jgi:NADP-dependent 3-hydroxy acid dehydrogenase YdfG